MTLAVRGTVLPIHVLILYHVFWDIGLKAVQLINRSTLVILLIYVLVKELPKPDALDPILLIKSLSDLESFWDPSFAMSRPGFCSTD